jgi:hypothetical protein
MLNGLLTVDIGRSPIWRAVFDSVRLIRLERAEGARGGGGGGGGGRILESVTRGGNGTVTYTRDKAYLRLWDIKEENAEPFSPDIWRN